jgi:hypothetical protein
LKTIKNRSIPWPVLFDGKGFGGRIAGEFGVFLIPQNWVVNRAGKIEGFAGQDALEEVIQAVLSKDRAE